MLSNPQGAMTPARKVLKLLQQRGVCNLKELAAALGVTRTAVRQQVTTLLAEKLITGTVVRSKRGRPYMAYRLSDKGRNQASQLSEALALVLLEAMLLSAERWQVGQRLQDVSTRLGGQYAEYLQGETSSKRLHELGIWFETQGISSQVCEAHDALLFTVYGCPYYRLAQAHREVCALETEAMTLALGAPVTLLCSQLDGYQGCQFRVLQCHASGQRVRSTA